MFYFYSFLFALSLSLLVSQASPDPSSINLSSTEHHFLPKEEGVSSGEFLTEGYPVAAGRSEVAGTGMFAMREIIKGEAILCVPYKFIIDRSAISNAGFFPIVKAILGLSSDLKRNARVISIDLMALFVMKMKYDRGHDAYFDSEYRDYAQTIRYNASYVPMTWDLSSIPEESDAYFGDIPVFSIHLRSVIEKRYDEYVRPNILERFPKLFGNPVRRGYSKDRYVHARAHVASRAYSTTYFSRGSSIEESGGILIPGLDLFNHPRFINESRDTLITPVRRRGMCIFAGRNFARGEEIFSSYGNTSSLVSAPNYGFVPDTDEKIDIIPLKLDSGSLKGIKKEEYNTLFGSALVQGTTSDPDTMFTYVTRTSIVQIIPFFRHIIAVSQFGIEKAVSLKSRSFCTKVVDFVQCGINKENEISARKAATEFLVASAKKIKYGSVAEINRRIEETAVNKLTDRENEHADKARLMNQLRRRLLEIIESAIKIMDMAYRKAVEELFDAVVLSPPVLPNIADASTNMAININTE